MPAWEDRISNQKVRYPKTLFDSVQGMPDGLK